MDKLPDPEFIFWEILLILLTKELIFELDNESEIEDKLIKVRVRSSGKFLDAEISKSNDSSAEIKLLESETAVSPGQACVFYREDINGMRLLGGGWIKSTN